MVKQISTIEPEEPSTPVVGHDHRETRAYEQPLVSTRESGAGRPEGDAFLSSLGESGVGTVASEHSPMPDCPHPLPLAPRMGDHVMHLTSFN
jgi:hypothetical protein